MAATLTFVVEPDGSFLVAAGDPDAGWAANLDADSRCRVIVGATTTDCEAEELTGRDRAAAIRELILRGGTPSERLGVGPAFRLRPRPASAGD
jgi:hypothetical protein